MCDGPSKLSMESVLSVGTQWVDWKLKVQSIVLLGHYGIKCSYHNDDT